MPAAYHGDAIASYPYAMPILRQELSTLVDSLTAASHTSHEVSLDTLGDAIGARSVSYDEIDDIIAALEERGRRVVAESDGRIEDRLRAVVAAGRTLTIELARRPTVPEIADRTRLSSAQVRSALMLARVMQR
jgi:hypothetical protein